MGQYGLGSIKTEELLGHGGEEQQNKTNLGGAVLVGRSGEMKTDLDSQD